MTLKQWGMGLLSAALIGGAGYFGVAIIETRENVAVMLSVMQTYNAVQSDHEARIRAEERVTLDHEGRIRALEGRQ